ncbi:Di-copper centre-containing protein [Sporormia fimetaria CBS 119925]|uniref:tyrosinase n=1 Tax=Sporormia fimetaria CBS 119925 TaxID=1340428 RepID=A0A6A6VMY9_9PLEO|nr:Di-copper centre-containing protein [Sporormia fimetaria CBS 119925]
MLKGTFVAAASLLACITDGSPVKPLDAQLIQRQSSGPGSYFAITGATGGVHPRLELRDLETKGEMWNLFLLAMRDFQAMDQNDIASWYSIAGLWPQNAFLRQYADASRRSWDGVEGTTEGKDTSEMGYCPHANLLFGTWHRPYLALFEQQLQTLAKRIADQFPTPTRTTYQDAATKLRLPYWDWAKDIPTNVPAVPTSMSNDQVQVTFPNGTKGQIRNPLFEYRFHPKPAEINGTGCARVPTPNGPVGGDPGVCELSYTVRNAFDVSDHAGLNMDLHGILKRQRSTLYNILSQFQHFDYFSNDGGGCLRNSRVVGNLEALHNPIHTNNWPGHMSPASVSAFDPMFWLHHANVDRQLAIYQAIYPDTYVEPCASQSSTFTIEEGEMLDAESPLTPFHSSAQGTFWTSAAVRDIETFSYTYPELVDNTSNTTLVANVRSQYGPKTSSSTKAKREQMQQIFLLDISFPINGYTDGHGSSLPYNVAVFVDDVPADPKKWFAAEGFVGVVSALGGIHMVGEQMTRMTMELSDVLAANKVSVDEAEGWLMERVRWRLGLGDTEIRREEVKGVKVELVSTEVKVSGREDVFDEWVGEYTRYGLVDV